MIYNRQAIYIAVLLRGCISSLLTVACLILTGLFDEMWK